MGLRDTYAHAIQTAKGKFHGNAEERDGKLYFKGTIATEAEKNELWTAIKTIPTWQQDIVADIQVTGAPAAAAPPAARTYTVKAGDTVSVSGVRAKIPTSTNIGVATITTADGKRIYGSAGQTGARGEGAQNN